MRKKRRVFIPLLLILAFMFSLSLPALADSDPGSGSESDQAVEETAEDSAADGTESENEEEEETAPAEGTADNDLPSGEEEESELITVPAEQGYEEIFVASYGSDSADGSRANPVASLAEAARRANDSDSGLVYVLLLTDLTSWECARFFTHDVYISSDADPVTVTRGSGFASSYDARRGVYHPAMIEAGDVTGTGYTPARIFIENLTLDDAGSHEGELFEAQKPAGEGVDNLQYVQDGIVSSYNTGAAVTLGSGAELRNFGGLAAANAAGGSRLTLDDYSVIRDTMPISSPDGLRAVSADASSKAMYASRAHIEERAPQSGDQSKNASSTTAAGVSEDGSFDQYSSLIDGVLPADSASGMSSLAFAGPKELIRVEDGILEYEVPYALSFTLTESGVNAIRASAALISNGNGTITVTLDSRLQPKLESDAVVYSLESAVFEVTAIAAEGNTITASIRLKDNWKEKTEQLSEPMKFVCTGILPVENFEDGDLLASTGKVELTLHTDSKSIDLSSAEMTAKTKMLPPRSASVVYDPNGGEGAPAPAFVSAQTGYELDAETRPTHADVNGKPVVFIGWTLEQDTRIYADREEEPKTVTSVDVEPVTVTTVYAVYGYDENGDGIADVTQTLLTLSYDANGGEGAPDPEVKAAAADLGAHFDISEVEPTRKYYTFQGWSKDKDATEADYKYDAEKKADRDLLILKDTTLYAVWKENPTYTLYYNANGGTNAPEAQSAVSDGGYVELTITSGVPVRAGYRFLGWSATRRGNAAYFAGDSVRISNGNVMLYAVWEKEGSSSGGSGGSPRTGDEAPLDLYAALLLVSLIAACVSLRSLQRKRTD